MKQVGLYYTDRWHWLKVKIHCLLYGHKMSTVTVVDEDNKAWCCRSCMMEGLDGTKKASYVWWRQFVQNFIWGTIISGFWYYVGFKLTDSFWFSTVLTNVVTYFIGRYIVFPEGKK